MVQKGNYQKPTVLVVSFNESDMIRTSLELEDGVAMTFDDNWVAGAEGGNN